MTWPMYKFLNFIYYITVTTCSVYTICSESKQLYYTSLWLLSSPVLHNIEVAFNKILRKIWRLPRHSHTGIVHSVANLYSLFNVVFLRSQRLMLSAMSCSSLLARQIFSDSCSLCYSFTGYNSMCGHHHLKRYDVQDKICAGVIRALRCSSLCLDSGFEDMIYTIACDQLYVVGVSYI